jgi:hypothetical protein
MILISPLPWKWVWEAYWSPELRMFTGSKPLQNKGEALDGWDFSAKLRV